MTDTTIRYDVDADGIVTLTLDDPTSSANTMNSAYVRSMSAVVDRLYDERDAITGVVITSAKKTFFAGGDLVSLRRATPGDAPALFTEVERNLAAYAADTVFVVYCAGPHCNGADKAAVRLARLGRPVKKMIGGVEGWIDEGFELVGG